MTDFPEYFEFGTRVLSAEERANPMTFIHRCDV
jgi:hypothetical protein